MALRVRSIIAISLAAILHNMEPFHITSNQLVGFTTSDAMWARVGLYPLRQKKTNSSALKLHLGIIELCNLLLEK